MERFTFALFSFLYLGVIIGLISYFFVLLHRMATAQKEMARHLYEIACDVKLLSLKGKDEPKTINPRPGNP